MENSFDRANESLNPQQPLKVDDKQNLFANTLVVGTVESISQSSGLGLNHTVQSAIDKWMGKQATDLSSLVGNPTVSNNSFKSAAISVVQAPVNKIYQAPLATLIKVAPAVVKKPADIVPTGLVVNGVKPSYDVGSTLSINPSFVVDGDGWKDISKVDFWLTDSKNKRVELADVTSFVAKDPKDTNTAKFSYSTSLKGIAAGDYKLMAVAYDKFGATSNQFTQAIAIKTVYQIGFDGTKTDATFVSTFNKLNGVQILGKATNNISSITGGKVQNFEKGSIFQSAAGTFSLQGTLNNFYKDLSAADKLRLGMPTANETSVGGYWHQSFQNGELQLVQGMPVKWSDLSLITDRFNLLGGAATLGKSVGTIRDLNGGKVQDYEKGSIFAYGNKTVAVTGSISTYHRANSAALGLPVSEEITTGYGKRQDFSNGKTLIDSVQFGTQVLQGSLGGYYRGLSETQRNQLGAPYTGENDLIGGNWRQFFKGGTVEWKNNGTGEVKLTPFTIGFNGTAVNTDFTNEFNKVVGWEALGNATGNVRSINGATVQDFEKGSIFKTAAGTFAVRGSIGIYYRANSATLLLPTSAEVATSYGWRQDFQGAVVTHSPQFGTHTLNGSVGTYYAGLTAAQKDRLGAATTEAALSGDGHLQQFFQGGVLAWRKNNAGDLMLTPFTIGFDGNNFNPAFSTKFNAGFGWDVLGKPTGNVRSISGATVQDFEKGSIFQTAAGTFVMRGQIAAYYSTNSAALGLPTSDKVSTSYGGKQEFQNALVTDSPMFGVHTLHGSVGSYYRGLSAAQQDKLGAAVTEEAVGGDGNWQQFFKGGSVLWKSNGTGEVKFTEFTIGSDAGNDGSAFSTKFNEVVGWTTLGNPTGNIKSITDKNKFQDFEKGSIFQSAKGTFILDGTIRDMYREQYSNSIGFPIGNKVSTVNGIRQDFENGILINTQTSYTFLIKGAIASYYKGLNDTQLQALGVPIGNAGDSNGGVAQYFKNGIVYSSSFGTFSIRGVFSERASGRGVPLGEEKIVGDGLRQDFSEGSATYSAKAGIHEITGGLIKYYQGLTESQKTQLGVAYTNTWTGGNNAFQFFQGGVIELNRNGASQIRFTPAIGFDGNTFNEKFFDKYMSMDNLDGLGDPITNVFSINGVLRQDFIKGFITQNGSLVEGKPYGGTITITNDPPVNSGTVIYIGVTPPNQNNASFVINGGGSIGNFYNNIISSQQRQYLGNPTDNEFVMGGSLEWRQDFNGGSIFHGVNGTFIVQNTLLNSYNNLLSDSDRQRLGMPTGNETFSDGYWHQSFKNGQLQLISNSPVKWNNGVISTPPQTNGKFSESFEILTDWYAEVFKWDGNGQPPANFYSGGWNASSNGLAQLNLGSNTLSNGTKGISFNVGANALKGYNDRLPVDNFVVRAYTQAGFDGGQYKFKVHGDDGYQIFAKNIATGQWTYITPQDQWQTTYDVDREITVALAAGRYDLHFHYFERGGAAALDLSWDKVGSPKVPDPIPTAGTINYKQFTGVVTSTIGINLRQGVGTNYAIDSTRAYNQTLQFDAWTTGESVFDPSRNAQNNQWFRVTGTNDWVSGAYIDGTPDRSVSTPQQPTNSGQIPTNGGSSTAGTVPSNVPGILPPMPGTTVLTPGTPTPGLTPINIPEDNRLYHQDGSYTSVTTQPSLTSIDSIKLTRSNPSILDQGSVNISLYNSAPGQSTAISNKNTWVFIHGLKDNPSNQDEIIRTLRAKEGSSQVLVLDWKEAAALSPNTVHRNAVNWIDDIGHAIANKLIQGYGINPAYINLVGHSYGSLVAYKISEYVSNLGKGKIDRLVALDPGGLSSTYNSGNVDFTKYSHYSRSFYGSLLSDEGIALKAGESFKINFSSNNNPIDRHNKVVNVFVDLLKNWNSFQLSNMNSVVIAPWSVSATDHEAEINADINGTVQSVIPISRPSPKTSTSISGYNT